MLVLHLLLLLLLLLGLRLLFLVLILLLLLLLLLLPIRLPLPLLLPLPLPVLLPLAPFVTTQLRDARYLTARQREKSQSDDEPGYDSADGHTGGRGQGWRSAHRGGAYSLPL